MKITENSMGYRIFDMRTDAACDDNVTVNDVVMMDTPHGLVHVCEKCGREVAEVREFDGTHYFIHGPFAIAKRLVFENDAD